MNPTEHLELKKWLAEQLGNKVLIAYTNPTTHVTSFLWHNSDPRFVEAVKDTEWLAIVAMVEEQLSKKITNFEGYYQNTLNKLCYPATKDWEAPIISYKTVVANWPTRAKALQQVLYPKLSKL
jgi:hypothetical protein